MLLADIGNFALIVAFVLAFFSIAASLLGAHRLDPRLLAVGERSVHGVTLLVLVATLATWGLILNDNFGIDYVAGHSNAAMPLHYKIGALWAGQDGSLLLWTLVLVGFASAAVFTQRKKHNRLMPYAIAVMMGTTAFFLYLNNFRANPFDGLMGITQSGQEAPWAPADGRGLNPLLQHWAMVIHPPILYVGYIGFIVPFAFCIAALWTRQLGSSWVSTVRRFTLVSWIFLGIGILLGGKWAYMELGWGGYWAWDPVENASLMPWLTGTAFLHSVIVQEKRGMLKVWNVSLISLTYLLSILGTFLTRSGVVSSVHSFAQSNIGGDFAFFLIASTVLCTALIVWRLPFLRSEGRLDSMISRESGFLFNNLLLLAAALSVLFGTVFPIFSELITGRNVSVGQAYFNRIEIPLGLALLFLTGAGPLLAYRKTSKSSLRKNFTMPVAVAIVSAPLFFVGSQAMFDEAPGVWAMISLVLCLFVTMTIVQEFHKGTAARIRKHGENYLTAMVNLTRRNNRRYGGYVVHFGIVLIFLGITGQAFTRETRGVIGVGEEMRVGQYELRIDEITQRENANYWSGQLEVAVSRGGQEVFRLQPEKRFYFASEQPSSEVAIARQLREDLYLVYAGLNEDQTKAVVQAYVNPLVAWVWIGGAVMILGTAICLLPALRSRREDQATSPDRELLEVR
ncbi:MAG TPA: heme lyase CcmF/NrfE family subunit [Candidatus Krumholzibacteria bacterium]|nr:heme lyase CcmF/NrfE family subunit [Candidatus Krumholzibacteria bacterium]